MRKTVTFALALAFVALTASLSVAAQTSHSVALTWNETSPSDPAISFNVCRSLSKGGELPCGTPLASTTSTSYTDTAVTSGTTYWYVVVAVDAGGKQSSASNEVSALIPGPTPPVLNTPVVAWEMPTLSGGNETYGL